jgi:hypothetical protein
MGNKTTIQVAKWLIVVGILCPILRYCFENFEYQEICIIANLIQAIGWFLLLAASKNKHWRLASVLIGISILVATLSRVWSYGLSIILYAVAFSALSFGRTQRYKNSVVFGLIAMLLPFLLVIFNTVFNTLKGTDIGFQSNLFFRLNFFVCVLIEAFAIGRMITFYERGEGSADFPLQMKGIFSSRNFCAVILFLFIFLYIALPYYGLQI